MYKIEKKDYGYLLTFSDFIRPEEMQAWLHESQTHLRSAPKNFGIFVDMRTLKPLSPDSQMIMQEGQKLYQKSGMIRSVVVVSSSIIKAQFTRIAKETGIYQWERYVDSSSNPNWERIGVDWLTKGTDPDKQ